MTNTGYTIQHSKVYAAIIPYLSAPLIALWLYAALSKLSNYEKAKASMLKQVFPQPVAEWLTWMVPSIELLAAALLLYLPTKRKGLYLSAGLLTLFSLYILLVQTGMFGHVPCSCGGILEKLSYSEHLIVNLLFLSLALVLIRTDRLPRLSPGTGSRCATP